MEDICLDLKEDNLIKVSFVHKFQDNIKKHVVAIVNKYFIFGNLTSGNVTSWRRKSETSRCESMEHSDMLKNSICR